MRRACSLTAAALALAGAALPAAAQDPAAGRAKAKAACAICHGELGIAGAPDAPHLAGQSAVYVIAQLRAFRDGTRKHEVMAVIAKTLSDADIANIAEWYSVIRVEAKEPK